MNSYSRLVVVVLLVWPYMAISGDNPGPGRVNDKVRAGVMVANTDTNVSGVDSALAGSLYLDVDIIKYLGVRLGYRDIEKFETETETSIKLDYSENFHLGVYAGYVNASPFTPYIGMQYMQWDLSVKGLGEALGEADGSETGIMAGVRMDLSKSIGLNFEYLEFNNIEDADIEYVQIGAYLRFR